jgi:hypothetical protein
LKAEKKVGFFAVGSFIGSYALDIDVVALFKNLWNFLDPTLR